MYGSEKENNKEKENTKNDPWGKEESL